MNTSAFPFALMAKPAGSRCNHSCDYCFYRDKGRIFPSSSSPERMSSKVLASFVEQFIASQPEGSEVRFIWQGGEPLLCGLDFFNEVVELQTKFAQGHPIQNALQTNGSLIDEAWADFFKTHHFLVGLSLDGPESIHNHYRHSAASASGAHEQALAGLHRLRDKAVEVNVLVTVNRYNQQFPEEIYDFIKAQGIQYMQFIPIVERLQADSSARLLGAAEGGEWKMAPWSVTPREFGNFLRRLFVHWCELEDVGKISVQIFEALASYCMGYPSPICTFSTLCGQTPVLEKNGDLFCCDHYVEKLYRLGNILETPLMELVTSGTLENFSRLKMKLSPQCKGCSIVEFCQGDCPKHRLGTGTGSTGELAPSYLCKAYRYFFQYAEPRLRAILAQQF